MDDTNEALKIWDALKPMVDREIKEKTASCIRSKKMTVTSAPNGTTIGVCEPFDTVSYNIPYSSAVNGASVGDAVWVQWYFNNASTMIAMSFGGGDSGFVAKTGDTMTGVLDRTFSGIDLSSTPSGNKVYSQFRGYDKNGLIISGINAAHNTSGYSGIRIGARRIVNGSEVANDLHLYVGPTGTRTVSFSEKDPWKSALDIDDLEDAIGNAEFVNKTGTSGASVVFNFSNSCAYIIFISGSAGNLRSIIWGYCTGAGAISVSKMDATSSNVLSTATATNKLTINNSGSATFYATLLKLSGTAPT